MHQKYNITNRIKYLIANIESDLNQIKNYLPKLSDAISDEEKETDINIVK